MSKEANSTERALKLALEALEYIEHNYMSLPAPAEKAITALREALAQQALDKKAENARELGLDYEPVCNKEPQGCWNVRCQLGKKCKNTQAQRTWVSLTDEEIAKEFYKFEAAGAWYQFARAIEAAHGIKENT